IPLPNPWCVHANGLLIQHVPVVLYPDYTLGNIPKKWNKDMPIYTTLAGLPPKLSNQEYNIHCLATTNMANALGLLVELKINKNGFVAYNSLLKTNLLVNTVPPCNCGDYPMHVEISNMTNPSMTLKPCRICNLSVESHAKKYSESYIKEFLGIDD
ncbi:hypothetical protein DFH28DRAFT_868132, partial [Melampsora americana]